MISAILYNFTTAVGVEYIWFFYAFLVVISVVYVIIDNFN